MGPYTGQKWGALCACFGFWSGSLTTINIAVCFAISGPQTVCLAPFISLTTAAGECAFAFLLVVLINCDFNVKEGLMKYSRKSCDALQRKRIQN